jgi:Tetratricopeptide repeat
MVGIGNFLSGARRLTEACAVETFHLTQMAKIHGREHPDTILAMHNLAVTLGDQGQLDEAAKIEKEVLEKRRRILGDEHPDTISAMHNLTNTLGSQEQLDEAAKMKRRCWRREGALLAKTIPTLSRRKEISQIRLESKVSWMKQQK